jgi:hypothetical protein
VQCEIAGLRVERKGGQVVFFVPIDPVLDLNVRSSEDQHLAVGGVGVVELDPGLDEWAHHAVTADPSRQRARRDRRLRGRDFGL